MALIVEDGSGKADAESYISVVDASAYHASLGNAAWAALASDTVREQLLRRATIYMLGQYRDRWDGYRVTASQALDWPRDLVPMRDAPGGAVSVIAYYPNNSVPAAVQRACADLALTASTTPLAPDQARGILREKIGPIETEYDPNSPQATQYRAVDMALKPFLRNGGAASVVAVRRA